jgi:TusA-related sulfurtransferase
MKGIQKFFCAFLMVLFTLSGLTMTKQVVFANGNTPNVTKVRIGKDVFLDASTPYLVDGAPSSEVTGATASLIGGVLTLDGYDDKQIAVVEPTDPDTAHLKVSLIGHNTITNNLEPNDTTYNYGLINDIGGSIEIHADDEATLTIRITGAPSRAIGIGVHKSSTPFRKLDLTISGKAMVTTNINSNISDQSRNLYSINLHISDSAPNSTFSILDDASISSSAESSLKEGVGYSFLVKGKMIVNTTGSIYLSNSFTTNNWPLITVKGTLDLIKVKEMKILGNKENTAAFVPIAPNATKNFADDICIMLDEENHEAIYRSGGCSISVINGEANKAKANVNETITIKADDPPAHLLFNKWTSNDVTVDDETSPTTTFVMPRKDVSVKATYKDNPDAKFNVTVTHGSGSGDYFPDDEVEIKADLIPGKAFEQWEVSDGVTLKHGLQAESTSFTMPKKDVVISALYKDIVYTIIEGADQSLDKAKLIDLVVKADGEFVLFDGVNIDNKPLDSKHYQAEAGSTIVRVFKEYLAGLDDGKHSIDILFADGVKASSSFTLVAAPVVKDDDKPIDNDKVIDTDDDKTIDNGKDVELVDKLPKTGNHSYKILALLMIAMGWSFIKQSQNKNQ